MSGEGEHQIGKNLKECLYMNENDSFHEPGRMSVYVCEGGGERVSTLSRTAHTHIHIYTPTHRLFVCVGEGSLGSLMLYHLRVGGECRIDSCMDASVQIYECVSELLN